MAFGLQLLYKVLLKHCVYLHTNTCRCRTQKEKNDLLSTVEWKDLRYADVPDDVVSGSFSVSKTNNVFFFNYSTLT